MIRTEYLTGGRRVGHWFYVSTDYFPAWRDFEARCGTLADDECVHGKTPAERNADPAACACGDEVRFARDATA